MSEPAISPPSQLPLFESLTVGIRVAIFPIARNLETLEMVLRIESVSDGRIVVLRLSGRLQAEQVEQLKEQIEKSTMRVILDLSEVKLVDRDAVRFLGTCETNGVQLNQCSPYIRDWIDRERVR